MRKPAIISILIILQNVMNAQSQDILLIVRGDDIGSSHAANMACIESYKSGIETSVEVMVPCSWFEEAAKMLNENPGLDVGVHLVLTSEWENIKWGPLTCSPGLVDENGYFFPRIWKNEDIPSPNSLRESDWTIQEIENEFRAQIEKAVKRIPHVSHLTGHMGCTHMSPEVNALAEKLAIEYGLPIKLNDIKRTPGFGGGNKSPAEKGEALIDIINDLTPGTWLFVDHPGLDNPEMQAIGHVGNYDVAFNRNGVTRAFTDERVKKAIREKGIRLVSYKDVIEMQEH